MALDELEYPEEGPSPMISTMMQRSPNELQESSSGIVLQDSSGISPTTDFSSPDEHIEMQTCQRIALGRRIAVNGSKVRAWNETMEFQNNFNATGILGEVLAWAKTREKSSRLVRMIYPSSQILEITEFTTRRDFELLGLDDHDRAFLSAKGVFELPAAQECEEFLEAYFRYVYPYAPIMDRTELLELYSTGEYSAFLMQSLLANVVPYVSKDLIKRAGFPDHGTAQKSFYDKAVLLHDFNCERSQLILLQGSLLLGTQWVSFKLDRDYRFWLSNACRIATRMGLHSAQIEEEVESDFYKLLRRIWWIIYIRDVVVSISGLNNARYIRPEDCDIPELTENDWPEEIGLIPGHLQHLISPVTATQKQFLIQLCKLSIVGDEVHRTLLTRQGLDLDESRVTTLLNAITDWRVSLPPELRLDRVILSWQEDGLWILVLMAWCHRMEVLAYRTLRKAYNQDNVKSNLMQGRLHNAMFDLDTTIRRAVVNGVSKLLPMSFSTSVATSVVLFIERILTSDLSRSERLICEEAVRTGIAFLSDAQETWTILRSTLRLFGWAFVQAGLPFDAGLESPVHRSMDLGLTPPTDQDRQFNGATPRPGLDIGLEAGLYDSALMAEWQSWIDLN